MFGRNVPIKPIYTARDSLNVIKVWRTIQGEGPFAGNPAVFVRLAGCNLRCYFCDTEFSEGAKHEKISTLVEEVVAARGQTPTTLVVITGGEPLAQPIGPFAAALTSRGYHVQIETAGTVWQPGLEELCDEGKVTLVCSPKTPTVHPRVIAHCRQWKYIIEAEKVLVFDGLPAASTQDPDDRRHSTFVWRPRGLGVRIPADQVWVQPCDTYRMATERPAPDLVHDVGRTRANAAACVESAETFGYRISLQLHKMLNVE